MVNDTGGMYSSFSYLLGLGHWQIKRVLISFIHAIISAKQVTVTPVLLIWGSQGFPGIIYPYLIMIKPPFLT